MPFLMGVKVDDHGYVLVTCASMAPNMLIHADNSDSFKPDGVVDQEALSFGQHSIVGGGGATDRP